MMYMKALAEEWKKRDREREVLMKKKVGENSISVSLFSRFINRRQEANFLSIFQPWPST